MHNHSQSAGQRGERLSPESRGELRTANPRLSCLLWYYEEDTLARIFRNYFLQGAWARDKSPGNRRVTRLRERPTVERIPNPCDRRVHRGWIHQKHGSWGKSPRLNRAWKGGKPVLNSGIEKFTQGLGNPSKVGGLGIQDALPQTIGRKPKGPAPLQEKYTGCRHRIFAQVVPKYPDQCVETLPHIHRIQTDKNLRRGVVQPAGLRSVSETNLKQRPFTTRQENDHSLTRVQFLCDWLSGPRRSNSEKLRDSLPSKSSTS